MLPLPKSGKGSNHKVREDLAKRGQKANETSQDAASIKLAHQPEGISILGASLCALCELWR